MVDERKVQAKERLLDVFRKKGKSEDTAGRVPPGQRLTPGFPVLDLGVQPEIDLKEWRLEIRGVVEYPGAYGLEDLKKLGVQHYTKDFHCVTTWSKLDVSWTGIPFRKIIEHVAPQDNWKFLIQHGKDGYSTNVTREDVDRDDVFLAFELEGKPIPREHGTVRLIIPHLYAWKGSKFLTALEFSVTDEPGFWEVRGYHNRGNAQQEERFS